MHGLPPRYIVVRSLRVMERKRYELRCWVCVRRDRGRMSGQSWRESKSCIMVEEPGAVLHQLSAILCSLLNNLHSAAPRTAHASAARWGIAVGPRLEREDGCRTRLYKRGWRYCCQLARQLLVVEKPYGEGPVWWRLAVIHAASTAD